MLFGLTRLWETVLYCFSTLRKKICSVVQIPVAVLQYPFCYWIPKKPNTNVTQTYQERQVPVHRFPRLTVLSAGLVVEFEL